MIRFSAVQPLSLVYGCGRIALQVIFTGERHHPGETAGTRSHVSSAKRSTCCGAGRVFWTADPGSEPAVVLGYCGDPLECWGAVVLWCRGGRLFASAFRKLPMSEFVDLVNSTSPGRIFFVVSPRFSRKRPGALPPRLHTRTRRSPTLSSPGDY